MLYLIKNRQLIWMRHVFRHEESVTRCIRTNLKKENTRKTAEQFHRCIIEGYRRRKPILKNENNCRESVALEIAYYGIKPVLWLLNWGRWWYIYIVCAKVYEINLGIKIYWIIDILDVTFNECIIEDITHALLTLFIFLFYELF